MNGLAYENSALGALQSEHKRARKFTALLIAGIVLTLLIALGLAAMLLFADSSGKTSDTVAVYVILGLCLAFAAFFAVILLYEKDVRVQVFENGLTFTRGAKLQAFLWDEIELFWTKIVDNYVNGVRMRTSEYTLQKANGEKLRLLHSIENVEQIGRRIDEEVFRRIFPRDLQTIKNGAAVPFGKFAVTPAGIQKDKDFIRWADVKAVQTKEGKIRVENQNGKNWASVLYSNIPNALIFLALAEEMKR